MQNQTPLFTKLVEHASRNPIQFHIPAHKKGFGMPNEFSEFIGPNALSIDLINIAPLDDLHSPKGIIKEAQELAARAYGADHTYFSVHGTSGAIMTMVMAAVGPGEKILVPRNVHKSILSAIIFSGAHPVFMHPEIDPEIGIAHGVSLDTVRKALDENADAKALLLINPTYFGVSADLKSIVDLSHERGIPVLVDEAHGVLFGFHEDLPLSAMQAGADMAATSVHKLGGSMTQSSVLNVREGLVSPDHVQSVLSMLHTTSTSYLLLASLDVARKNLAIHGHDLITKTLELARACRNRINAIDGLYCFGDEILKNSATFAHDPLKINVTVSNLGLTGWEVEKILRTDFNIEVEMSDLYNILCIITFGDTQETIDALVSALEVIATKYRREVLERKQVKYPSTPLLALSPRDAFYNKQTEIIPLAEAAGRIIAEFIMVYPPGIPIVMPGEVVTTDNIDYIVEHVKEGLPVQGPDDPNIEFVKVLK
ncbi:aminotransferase class I/II-fold pyridoxal phosphate-dependent enzyme [Tumebacillus sp. ITR2]|uniref:Aminotransferase class I/II-fold pyridoxal phosphate-dependent enzyme n=1 Tax=Tumebacillus amylolyticus TaxID=2801339 RepID=A0ABS1J866_9BACL|nr:aminotransferase class I/II-fold pyridoxal phosphate-dependent enzyme [Tumebacillus amylolyticus]MBL0386444.1 aminotransferase class I/II-fold pyridoxal phosphate-dependent enzyme [Tumebacillus amylolyticus]